MLKFDFPCPFAPPFPALGDASFLHTVLMFFSVVTPLHFYIDSDLSPFSVFRVRSRAPSSRGLSPGLVRAFLYARLSPPIQGPSFMFNVITEVGTSPPPLLSFFNPPPCSPPKPTNTPPPFHPNVLFFRIFFPFFSPMAPSAAARESPRKKVWRGLQFPFFLVAPVFFFFLYALSPRMAPQGM